MRNIILSYIEEWSSASKKMQKVSEKQIVMLKWIKPPEGVMKINVDGSMKKDGSIGAGGLIRDSSGAWCGGFMINLGAGDILQSEAWGIFYGLQLALRYNHPIVQLESDSITMINLLLTDDVSFHPLGTVIKNCKLLCNSFQSCSFIHIHREKNIVADILAKASLENEKGIIWLDEVPAVATGAMLDDIAGVAIMRQVDVVVPHMSSSCDASPSMQPNTHDAQNPANGSTQDEAGIVDVLHSHMFTMPIPSRHHGDMNTTNAASFCSMTTTPTQHDADGEMTGLQNGIACVDMLDGQIGTTTSDEDADSSDGLLIADGAALVVPLRRQNGAVDVDMLHRQFGAKTTNVVVRLDICPLS